jgi:hypothetical protein
MKQFGIILFLQFLSLTIPAQNLVVDGSFELKTDCPPAYGLAKLIHWFTPNYASSDYMCECFPSDSFSGLERKFPFSGNCFIGLIPSSGITSGNDGNEYAATKLIDNLETGAKYCFSIYIVSSSNANYVIQNIHFGFDADSIFENTGTKVTIDKYYSLSNNIIYDSTDWREFEVEFIATGNERYLYIGNFDTTANLVYHDYNQLTVPPYRLNYAYYFFDNVSLTKCLPPLEDDFVIYPNPSNGGVIYTEFESDTTGVIELYNSLGQIVRSRDIPQGNFKGELFQQLATGVYIVTIQTDSGYRREQKLVVTK